MPSANSAGARIYFEEFGEGEPLLLIPGFGSTIEVYWANIPELSRAFHVISLDPRGCGRSDSGPPWTMQQYADDCAAVLDAAGVGSAHVVGASFGGMVAQHVALEHPGRVRGLVLWCTTPGGTQHVLPPPGNLDTFMAAAEVEDMATAVRMRYPMHYSDAFIESHDEEIVAQAVKNQALRSSPEGRAGQVLAVATHATWDRLPEISAHTLVMHGDEDGVVPVENGRNLASRIPGARLRIFEGAKHIFFVECAPQVNAEVIAFLRG